MPTDKLERYLNFAVTALAINLLFLLRSARSNYFFQNYLSVTITFAITLVVLAGVVRKGWSALYFRDRLCAVDYLLAADLVFNVFAVSYSTHPRASAEDVYYQLGYFCTYVIMRMAASSARFFWEKFLALFYLVNAAFSAYIFYVVFTKFQLISSDGRVSYNSMHPNMLSTYLTLAATIALYFLFKAAARRRSFLAVAAHAACFAFICFMVFMTSSRAGILGIFLGTAAIAYQYNRSSERPISLRKTAIVLLAAAAFYISVFPFHFERMVNFIGTKSKIMTLNSRTEIWRHAASLFSRHPILGVGPGVANYNIMEYSGSSMIDAHNFILEKLCCVGLIGTLLYLAPLLVVFFRARNSVAPPRAPCDGAPDGNSPEKTAMGYSTMFMIIAVFTQSSFSPLFAVPILSMMLYAIIGVFVTLDFAPGASAARTDGFRQKAIDLAAELVILTTFSIVLYYFLMYLTFAVPEPECSEICLWLAPLSGFLAAFFYFFLFHRPNAAEVAAIEAGASNNAGAARTAAVFITAFVFAIAAFTFVGFEFFVAEKANDLAMSSIFNFSAKNSLKYIDIALAHDPDNIAYLVNKSYILFLVEHIKNGKLGNSENIRSAIALLERCMTLFRHDPLVETNLILLKAKARNEVSYKLKPFLALRMDTEEAAAAPSGDPGNETLDVLLAKQNPNNAFTKYCDIFGEKALEKFLAANASVKRRVSFLITSEAELVPESELAGFVEYINMTLRAALNVDIPGIDRFLMGGVAMSFKSLEVAARILPSKDYLAHSVQFEMNQEVLASVINILPVIWKFGMNLKDGEVRAKFNEFFGTTGLFPVADYFILGNDSAEAEVVSFAQPLGGYLRSMALLSKGDFDAARKNQETVFQREKGKGITQINSILLAWIYYKKALALKSAGGESEEYRRTIRNARDLIYYSQMHTSAINRRDFVYKRDLIYGGSMVTFYYLPIQAYFNEYIMLTLVRMNRGDHRKVLPEIFGFVKNVIYAD